MGLYSRFILPKLCDFVLGRPFIAKLRRELLAGVRGQVLEINFGTGLNLLHYAQHVQRIMAIDPHVGIHGRAHRRIEQARMKVDRRIASSEQLPFENATFDSVVSTFTLCSIEDVSRAISEMHRVLKFGSHFLFLEHGLSPEPRVQAWQRRLNGLEKRLTGNCQLDRNIRGLVETQPFQSVEMAEFYLEQTPRTHGYIYRGVATK